MAKRGDSLKLYLVLILLCITIVCIIVSCEKKCDYTVQLVVNNEIVDTIIMDESDILSFEPQNLESTTYKVFDGWYIDSNYNEPYNASRLIKGESKLYAKFIEYCKIEYIVDSTQGSISGQSIQVIEKGECSEIVEIVANPTYRFIGWSDGCIAQKRNDIVQENRKITAIFEKEYKLSVTVSNSIEGNIVGTSEQVLLKGQTSSSIKAIPNLGYKFVCWSNGDTNDELTITISEDLEVYPIFGLDYLEVPIMTINTENSQEVVSKETYLKCVINIFNSDGTSDILDASAQIKGRGNYSWNYPKHPYRIKFDSKQKVLGMNKNKNWALLANYCDKTSLRSAIGFKTSQLIGKEYTVDSRFVALMINGEYLGLYQIAELIKEGSDRVNISDDGFIIENSQYDDKANKFFSAEANIFYNFKYPDDDEITETQVASAKSAIDEFEAILYADDSIAFSEEYGYRNYIDVESFAKFFLIHNVISNGDTNKYIYKYDNSGASKLFMGPVWDFEWSLGIGWYYGDRKNKNNELIIHLYQERLLEDQYYKSVIKGIWEQVRGTIKQDLLDYINGLATSMKESIALNFEKWQILDQQVSVGGVPLGSFEAELTCDKAYLSAHIDWLDAIIMTW